MVPAAERARAGPAGRAAASAATRPSTSVVGHVEDDQLLLRGGPRPGPARTRSASSATGSAGCRWSGRRAARSRPRMAPSTCSVTPAWSRGRCLAGPAAGPSGSGACRYSFSSTCRNFSGPQSASRNFSRAWLRGTAGSRSRGRPRCTPAHTSATRSGSTKTPSRWANCGLVDSPPPTHRSKPGSPSGPTHADEGDVVDLVVGAVVGAAGDRRLVLARQVGERRVADVAVATAARSAGVASSTSSAATPASGQPRMTRGVSPQASVVSRPDGLEPPPDLRHVLDADPVQLHVLPVGDVGDVPAELGADPGDRRAAPRWTACPPSIRTRSMK